MVFHILPVLLREIIAGIISATKNLKRHRLPFRYFNRKLPKTYFPSRTDFFPDPLNNVCVSQKPKCAVHLALAHPIK
jgi:hypothetical protein